MVKAVSRQIVLQRDRLQRSRRAARRASGITAAGLPVKGRSAKASTWMSGSMVIRGSAPWFRRVSASGLSGWSTWPSGIEMDQHLAAGKFARELGLDLARRRRARARRSSSGSSQMWNWAKSLCAAGAGAQIVDALRLAGAGGDGEEACGACSSGHSLSISWSTRVARGAPGAPEQPERDQRCRRSDRRRGAGILIERQRRDHRQVEQQVALIMDPVGADRDRAGAADDAALIGDQAEGRDDRDDARRRCHIRHWRSLAP